MRTPLRRGFTLIELLVVIAIIAILAAILFPVFAQARAKARQAACVSNQKQLATATLMYVQDYDETFPLAYGYYPGIGWMYNYYVPVPYNTACANGVCGPAYTSYASLAWVNSIQAYAKNYGIMVCPNAAKQSPTANTAAAGAPAVQKTSYTYNGLLMASPLAAIVSPSGLAMVTENAGKGYYNGYYLSNPVLVCTDSTTPCSYHNGTTDKNGVASQWYGFVDTANVHGQGMSYAYTDGHVKFKSLTTTTVAPNTTNYNFEPFSQYDANGSPTGAWFLGTHFYWFRPDTTF